MNCDELLPCAHCGFADIALKHTGKNELTIRCPSCGISLRQKWLYYGEDWLRGKMIEDWNTRQPAPLAAEEGKSREEFTKTILNSMEELIVAMQAAWIEWKHGKGADAGMQWIENTLDDPGNIPDDTGPWGHEAQAWFDANRPNPMPACACGRPSNTLWMGQGFCSDEHYRKAKAEHRSRGQG